MSWNSSSMFNVFYEVNFTHLVINPIIFHFNNIQRFNYKKSSTSQNTSTLLQFDRIKGYSWRDTLIIECFENSFDWIFGVRAFGTQAFFVGNLVLGEIIQILVKNIMKSIVL